MQRLAFTLAGTGRAGKDLGVGVIELSSKPGYPFNSTSKCMCR